jgi:hypothetical protein
MPEPKENKQSDAGFQIQKIESPDEIKGFQPKIPISEDQLNPPSGGSNVEKPIESDKKE